MTSPAHTRHTGGEPLPSAGLEAYLAAHEAGSMQGAADALQLSQSAVTKRIQSLERRLGAPVFERGRFGVRPTPLGRAIYLPAKQALAHLQEIARTAHAGREREQSELRLSASHTIGEYLLPLWISELRQRDPRMHPQLEIINSAGALAALREGRSAIVFIESLDPLPGLEAITVARDELAVVVAAGHPWAARRSLSVKDLEREHYFTREPASGTRAVGTAALEAAGTQLTPSLEAASTQSLKRALMGGGFTIISRLAIREEVQAGTLVALPIRNVDLSRDLRAVRRRRPAASGAARAFWRWLAEQPPPSSAERIVLGASPAT